MADGAQYFRPLPQLVTMPPNQVSSNCHLEGLRTTLKLPAGKGVVAIVRYQPPGLVLGAILSMLATALLVTQKMKKR